MRLFERIVVVDWSANSVPKLGADSIWIAVHDALSSSAAAAPAGTDNLAMENLATESATENVATENVATRGRAIERLAELCDGSVRTLVGVDFSLGYPAGTAAVLGLDADIDPDAGSSPSTAASSWRAMWDLLELEIVDDGRNANNRFEVAARLNAIVADGPGPFWGCPPARRSSTLTSTKVPPDPLAEWRTTESVLRARGRRPFSSWQLLGAGSVGSQSLLGIAALSSLVGHLKAGGVGVDVWPFTTGLAAPERPIVFCEIWPTLVELPPLHGRVRDDVQVETVARHLARADHDGELAARFSPDVAEDDREKVEREEGWVLGA